MRIKELTLEKIKDLGAEDLLLAHDYINSLKKINKQTKDTNQKAKEVRELLATVLGSFSEDILSMRDERI